MKKILIVVDSINVNDSSVSKANVECGLLNLFDTILGFLNIISSTSLFNSILLSIILLSEYDSSFELLYCSNELLLLFIWSLLSVTV